MTSRFCPECATIQPVDEQGLCPEGHEVRVEAASGPEPWVGEVDAADGEAPADDESAPVESGGGAPGATGGPAGGATGRGALFGGHEPGGEGPAGQAPAPQDRDEEPTGRAPAAEEQPGEADGEADSAMGGTDALFDGREAQRSSDDEQADLAALEAAVAQLQGDEPVPPEGAAADDGEPAAAEPPPPPGASSPPGGDADRTREMEPPPPPPPGSGEQPADDQPAVVRPDADDGEVGIDPSNFTAGGDRVTPDARPARSWLPWR